MGSHYIKAKPDKPGWWWFSVHPGYTEGEPVLIEWAEDQRLMARNNTGGHNDYRGWIGFWSSEPISEPEPLGATLGLEDKE